MKNGLINNENRKWERRVLDLNVEPFTSSQIFVFSVQVLVEVYARIRIVDNV